MQKAKFFRLAANVISSSSAEIVDVEPPFISGVGNLIFTITSRMNCALPLAGRKINGLQVLHP